MFVAPLLFAILTFGTGLYFHNEALFYWSACFAATSFICLVYELFWRK